ncbi:MAG: hypothetical protein GEV07_22060 [Streptosporangiales bacterium]|nr:hypothetical protein [Streptosporangiales bacterium]
MTMTQLPPPREFPADRRAQTRELLEAAAARTLQPRRGRWLSRTTVVVVAAALFTGGGVATAYVAFRQADQLTDIRCYTKVDADQSADFPGTTVTSRGVGSQGRTAAADPIKVCGDLWRQGVLESGADTAAEPGNARQRAPRLQACVLDEGTAAVYPSRDSGVCRQLGLPRLKR